MPRLARAAVFAACLTLSTMLGAGCEGAGGDDLGQTGPSSAAGAAAAGGGEAGAQAGGPGQAGRSGRGGADVSNPGSRQGDAGSGGQAGGSGGAGAAGGGAAGTGGAACAQPDPQPTCPLGIPEPGSPCTTPQTCNHITALCFGIGISTCVATSCGVGAWKQDLPACNASGACALLQEVDCGTTSYCRWLEPGCSENPLPKASCFAKEPCATKDDCHAGTTCLASTYDPCVEKGCQACGAETTVCR